MMIVGRQRLLGGSAIRLHNAVVLAELVELEARWGGGPGKTMVDGVGIETWALLWTRWRCESCAHQVRRSPGS